MANDADFRTTGGEPASPIDALTCGATIHVVHVRFDSITSYHAEGAGLLIIPFLAAHLMTFRNLDSLPQINHNCDNQELIVKVKSMLHTKHEWWWYIVMDSDLICET